jgi:uncharacterized membrane protein HdeD (DUF308 family)
MKSGFDFVTAARLLIGFGGLLFLMGLAEFLGWVAHRARHGGTQQMLFGVSNILLGIGKLHRASWEQPTPAIEWVGLGFMMASVATMAYSWWSDRRARAGDKGAR